MNACFPGPRVPHPLIEDLLRAFVRRRKAIKYQLKTFEMRLGVEDACEASHDLQVLQVEARTLDRPPFQVSLKVWEDGEMWFQICRPGPKKRGGWSVSASVRGSATGLSGQKLVERYEASFLDLCGARNGTDLRQRIVRIWEGYLC